MNKQNSNINNFCKSFCFLGAAQKQFEMLKNVTIRKAQNAKK